MKAFIFTLAFSFSAMALPTTAFAQTAEVNSNLNVSGVGSSANPKSICVAAALESPINHYDSVATSAKACSIVKTRPQAICVAGALKSKINNYDSVAVAAGPCKAVTTESQAICVSAALLSPISTYDSIESAAKDCKIVDQP